MNGLSHGVGGPPSGPERKLTSTHMLKIKPSGICFCLGDLIPSIPW